MDTTCEGEQLIWEGGHVLTIADEFSPARGEELCCWRMSDELNPRAADTARALCREHGRKSTKLKPSTVLN